MQDSYGNFEFYLAGETIYQIGEENSENNGAFMKLNEDLDVLSAREYLTLNSDITSRNTNINSLKNVTEEFPPTLLIHGIRDSDVHHEQSELMEKEFFDHGVPHELFSVRNGEHSLWQGNPEDIEHSRNLILQFINKYMRDE